MTVPSVAGVALLQPTFTVSCFECSEVKNKVHQGYKNIMDMEDFRQHLKNLGWRKGKNNRYLCPYCYARLNNDTDRL